MKKESRFFKAAKRLDILLNGSAHDIFYHQSCYTKFLIKPVKLPLRDDLQKTKQKMF